MRVSPGASHRAGGPGGMVTGESDQAGARPYAPNGITHRTMGKPITDAIDNLEASIDEGGNWKTFERALELVCSQRVQNFWKAETSKHSTTKRKPTSHTLSVLAWLWTAPEPDKEHQTERAPPFPRPSSSNLSAHRRPLFGTSLVYVYDGGVIPHRWLISTIPTTAVTPHNNSDTPWGDRLLSFIHPTIHPFTQIRPQLAHSQLRAQLWG